MRRLAVVPLLALFVASPIQAQAQATFCDSPLMGACFYLQEMVFQEFASAVEGTSDYWMALRGYWSGPLFDGLTDLYWLARFDAFQTTAAGGSVWLMAMTPGEETWSGHEMRGQPQGLAAPSFSTLALRVQRGFPRIEQLVACGGGCTGFYDVPDEPTTTPTEATNPPPPVSVPEPGTWLLLATGLLGLVGAHRAPPTMKS